MMVNGQCKERAVRKSVPGVGIKLAWGVKFMIAVNMRFAGTLVF